MNKKELTANKPPKLPPQAQCVFTGTIFDVYQWQQKMFDGTTETFEKLKRPDTIQIIALVGDKIMLQEQEQPGEAPFLSLPGGRVDKGEEPRAAAERELLEETGYRTADWFLWKQTNPHMKIVWTVHTYIARHCVYVQPPQLDAGEKITTNLIPFDDFINLCHNENFREGRLRTDLLYAYFDAKKKQALYKKLFG